jgi:hypothetical protein
MPTRKKSFEDLLQEPLDVDPLEGFGEAFAAANAAYPLPSSPARDPLAPPPPQPEVEVEGPPSIRTERPGGTAVANPSPSATEMPPLFSPRFPPGLRGAPVPPAARSPLRPAAGGRPELGTGGSGRDPMGDLLQSQRHDALVRDANSVGDALYGAFTRSRPAAAKGTDMAGEFGAREGLADKELARAKAGRLERSAAIDADPTSEASRAAQAMVGELLPGFLPPETVAKLSKAQLEKMLPVLKDIEGTRATRTFQDEQRSKGEGFRAGESRLDRDLEREKLTAQQQAAADKAASDKLADGLKLTGDLRKEFNALPEVKAYKEVEVAIDKVKRAGSGTPNGASDMALLYAYMKLLDPGTGIKESEFQAAGNAGGLPARVQAQYEKLKTGALLNTEMRRDFIQQADGLYKSHQQQIAPVIERYRGLAEKGGIAADDVAVDPGQKVINGKTYFRKPNGKWAEED